MRKFGGSQKRQHLPHCLINPHKKSARNNRVPDIQRMKMGNVFDIFADIGIMEAVPRVDPQTKLMRKSRRSTVPRQFFMTLTGRRGIGVSSGM